MLLLLKDKAHKLKPRIASIVFVLCIISFAVIITFLRSAGGTYLINNLGVVFYEAALSLFLVFLSYKGILLIKRTKLRVSIMVLMLGCIFYFINGEVIKISEAKYNHQCPTQKPLDINYEEAGKYLSATAKNPPVNFWYRYFNVRKKCNKT